jgi:hypothetical protein
MILLLTHSFSTDTGSDPLGLISTNGDTTRSSPRPQILDLREDSSDDTRMICRIRVRLVIRIRYYLLCD